MQYLVIHYSEIGTKGNNRAYFENKLMDNLRKALQKEIIKVFKRYGKIVVKLKERYDKCKIKEMLQLLPGVSSFSFTSKCNLDFEKIKKTALEILSKEDFTSFKIETKRSNKQFPLKSPEINTKLGDYLSVELAKKVDMKKPILKLYLEIGEKETFIYTYKYMGIGGLPIGTAGKVLCSLSGGIDSPVAAFLAMKRGCEVVLVHFVNQSQTKEAVLSKLKELAQQLVLIQLKIKLYIVPFDQIQKKILITPSKQRMIIYRRFMMRILNELSNKEKTKAIITGDSIGQVASQTLENIQCIYDVAKLPVLAPLIGMNKEEITNLAKKINTYPISIQPYPDCCSFMIAKHPETKGKLNEIKGIESLIENKEELIKESISRIELFETSFT